MAKSSHKKYGISIIPDTLFIEKASTVRASTLPVRTQLTIAEKVNASSVKKINGQVRFSAS